MSKFETALKTFVEGCNKLVDDNWGEGFPENCKHTLEHRGGRKYAKIVTVTPSGETRSVHCFVNKENGDVLKAAGWKGPAKGARGNIFDDKNGLGRMSAYGPAYNR